MEFLGNEFLRLVVGVVVALLARVWIAGLSHCQPDLHGRVELLITYAVLSTISTNLGRYTVGSSLNTPQNRIPPSDMISSHDPKAKPQGWPTATRYLEH
jgi:hypothetical protein